VSKHFTTGVPKCQNDEILNAEINRHINKEFHRLRNNSISSFGYQELEESRLFIIRSPEITKCETSKSRKKEESFGYRELEESRLFIIRSLRIMKCETPKSRKQEDSFRYREMEESRPVTFHHRSPEVTKREIVKCSFE
jgi:hypothetical protein